MKKVKKQPEIFSEHLQELRRRLTYVVAFLVVGVFVGFMYHEQIEAIIQKPLGQTLYFTAPGGGLSFALQISLGVGIIFALPAVIYHLSQFIRPAVKPIRTKTIVAVVITSVILSLLAVVYTYYVSMPAALTFLVGFNSDSVQALINVSDYMSFIFAYFAGTIIAFQFPLALIFINKIKKIPPGGLLKIQKPVIVGIFVVSAILTPTVDPVNQLLMAGPMLFLFELGVMAVWTTNRRHARKALKTKKTRQPKPFTISYQPSRSALSRDIVGKSIKLIPGVLQVERVAAKTFDVTPTGQVGSKTDYTSQKPEERPNQGFTPRRLIVDFQ